MGEENSWKTSLAHALNSYRKQGYLCDMEILAKNGSPFAVHSCVVAATSSVFQAAIGLWVSKSDRRPGMDRLAVKTPISEDLLPVLIECMYTGITEVEKANVSEIEAAIFELGIAEPQIHQMNGSKLETSNLTGEENRKVLDAQTALDTDTKQTAANVSLLVEQTSAAVPSEGVTLESLHIKTEPDSDPPRNGHGVLKSEPNCDQSVNIQTRRTKKTADQPSTRGSGRKNAAERQQQQQQRSKKTNNSTNGKTQLVSDKEQSSAGDRPSDSKELHRSKHKSRRARDRQKNKFQCETCHRAFRERYDLTKHTEMVHKNLRPYECTTCDKTYKAKSALRKHQLQNRCGIQKKDLNFSIKESMQARHILSVSQNEEFQCMFCKAGFQRFAAFEKHLLKAHDSVHPYVCETCSKTYRDKDSFRQHSQVHSRGWNYQCDQCAKTFAFRSSFWKHKATAHNDIVRFNCSYCDKSYKVSERLKVHIQITHQGIRKFLCKHCPKSFGTKSSVDLHEKLHTGAGLLKCPQCSKTFYQKGALAVHTRMHTGERPYPCRYCHRKYTTNYRRKRHEQMTHVDKTVIVVEGSELSEVV